MRQCSVPLTNYDDDERNVANGNLPNAHDPKKSHFRNSEKQIAFA